MLSVQGSVHRFLGLLCIVLGLGGCATSSVFTPYPYQAAAMQQGLISGQLEPVMRQLQEEKESADRLLYLQESGRFNQLSGDLAGSRSDFEAAAALYEESDLAAVVQVSELGSQGSSLVTNDNAIPYKGAGYERILVHHFQAFNYLGKGDREGAGVEFRKAALEQRVLLQQYEKDIEEAHEEASEREIPVDDLAEKFTGLDTIAGPVKVSFQNPYTFYTSAVFWEATGELNDALVDYKKILEIYPDNTLVRQDVRRLSRRLGLEGGREDDNAPAPGQGTLVVLYEQDFIPPRSQFKLPIPTLDGGWITIAFPLYTDETRVPLRPLSLTIDGETRDTIMVADFGAQASRHLKEQLYPMLVRQALRGYAKYELQKESARQGGALGQFAANLYNILSENADLRSWLSLPAWGQAQRFNLEPGSHTLRMGDDIAGTAETVEIRPGRITVVRVVDAGTRRIVNHYPL